jgi:RNA polymerase sigma-32 factor
MLSRIDMSSLSLFYREVQRIPRLSRGEELPLARRWHDEHDAEAARTLVCSNLYGVAAIAREYRHFGLPEMDLVQEGTLGLMHAVKGFDPDRGFRLMTYAGWWIRAAIQEFILRNWSIVRVGTTKVQRKIFAGLRHAKEAIAALEGKGRAEVAGQYGLSEADYHAAANAYLQRDVSLDSDEAGHALMEALPASMPTPEDTVLSDNWRAHQRRSLKQAMAELPERDRMIVQQRHMREQPATLKVLSGELGVSIERVRQLESRALKRLKAAVA